MVAIKPQPRPTQSTTESPSTVLRSPAHPPPPSTSAAPIPGVSTQASQPYNLFSTIREGQLVPQPITSPAPSPTSQTTSTSHTPLALKWILLLPATLLLIASVLLCLFILDRNRREKRRKMEKLIHNPKSHESEKSWLEETKVQVEKRVWGPVGRKTMIFGTTQARKKRSPTASPSSSPTYSPYSQHSPFPSPTFSSAQLRLDHDHEKIGNSNLNAGMAFIPLADPSGNSIGRDSLIISPSPLLAVPPPCVKATTRRRLNMDGPYPSLAVPAVPLVNERRGSYKGLASLPFVLHEAKSSSPSPSSSRPLASSPTPLRTPTRQEIPAYPLPTLRPEDTPSIALQRATVISPSTSSLGDIHTENEKVDLGMGAGVDAEGVETEVDGEKQRTDRGQALKTLIGVDNFTSPPSSSFHHPMADAFHFAKTSTSACTMTSTSSAYSNSSASYSSPSPSPFQPSTRTNPHVVPIANKMDLIFTALSRPPSSYATQPPRNRRKVERFGQRGMAGMVYVPQKELGVVYECDSDVFGGYDPRERSCRDRDERDDEEQSTEEEHEHVEVEVDDRDSITDAEVAPIPTTQVVDLTPSSTHTTLEDLPPPQPAFHHYIPTYASVSTIGTYDSGFATAYAYDGDLSCSSSLSTAYSTGTIDEPRRSVWMSERDWVEGPVAF